MNLAFGPARLLPRSSTDSEDSQESFSLIEEDPYGTFMVFDHDEYDSDDIPTLE